MWEPFSSSSRKITIFVDKNKKINAPTFQKTRQILAATVLPCNKTRLQLNVHLKYAKNFFQDFTVGGV